MENVCIERDDQARMRIGRRWRPSTRPCSPRGSQHRPPYRGLGNPKKSDSEACKDNGNDGELERAIIRPQRKTREIDLVLGFRPSRIVQTFVQVLEHLL